MTTTITYKEFMKMSRKNKADTKKAIEAKIHPSPIVNGCEINHRHAGQYIYFSAWKGENRITERELGIYREEILDDSFFDDWKHSFLWLTEIE